MPMYRTRYSLPNGTTQVTQCYAENDKHLVEVIKLRGMNERRDDPVSSYSFFGEAGVLSQPEMPSTLLRAGKLAEANHALVWCAMIAVRANVTDAWGLLNDKGLIHELAHELHSDAIDRGPSYSTFGRMRRDALASRLEAFERLVPGLHPCWAGEDRKAVTKSFIDDFMELKTYPKTPMTIHRTVYGNHEERVLYETPRTEAPNEKAHERDFAKHQREQGAAVKAKNKAALIAKMKAKSSKTYVIDESSMIKPTAKAARVAKMKDAIQAVSRASRKGLRADLVILDEAIDAVAPMTVTRHLEQMMRAKAVETKMDQKIADLLISKTLKRAEDSLILMPRRVGKTLMQSRAVYPSMSIQNVIHDEIQITVDHSLLEAF